nr:Hsp70 family protein [Paraburkholderia lycopersici]
MASCTDALNRRRTCTRASGPWPPTTRPTPGELNLDGLALAHRCMPKIEVAFDIDASGIVNVSARDSATARAQSIQISDSTRLAEDVKKRMINEAE